MTETATRLPKLRFPEFKEPWDLRRLDWALKRTSATVDVNPTDAYREIGVRSHGKGIFHKETVLGAALGEKRVFWVQPNAFVVNIVFAWEQAVAVTSEAEKGFIASHRFPMFHPRENRADVRFIRDFFLRKRGKYLLELASPGGAGRNKTLGQSDFAALALIIPSTAEQKKISDFLEHVENRIGALTRKVEALKRYKREVARRLFARELRFHRDNGTGFPDWETTTLGNMIDWKRSNSFSREVLTSEPGTVQNIHYGDIHTKFPLHFRQTKQKAPYLANSIDIQSIKSGAFCEIGDIVIADASEDYADIGKVLEIIEVAPRSLVAGLHTHLARPKPDTLALGFGGYLFQSRAVRRQIMRAAQGISVLGISKTQIEKVKVELPHIDEQRRIADFLSVVDEKIDVTRAKIAATQAFKKGLLQQLFV